MYLDYVFIYMYLFVEKTDLDPDLQICVLGDDDTDNSRFSGDMDLCISQAE